MTVGREAWTTPDQVESTMQTVTPSHARSISPRTIAEALDALALELDAGIARLEGVAAYLDLVDAQLARAAATPPDRSA
jgi:hypothetical protein